MTHVVILCVEDEPEVRDALLRDLAPFAATFQIEATEDADEARQVIADLLTHDRRLGLVLCDHLMPGTSGVDLLVELKADPRTATARKVLVTGQAGLEDTVKAVNQARLDHYIAKPWTPEDLQQVVRDQLTDYVIDHEENLLPFMDTLDAPRLLEALRDRRSDQV